MNHRLRLLRLGIDTYLEPVLYMRSDSPACRAEGFEARSRVKVILGERSLLATLNVITGDLLVPEDLLARHHLRGRHCRHDGSARISHPSNVMATAALAAEAVARLAA